MPVLSQIWVGSLKLPSKIPELDPFSVRENPEAPSPPWGTPFIVQRLYRISLIRISTKISPEDVPTVSGTIVEFRFSPVALTPGETYYLEFRQQQASLAYPTANKRMGGKRCHVTPSKRTNINRPCVEPAARMFRQTNLGH